MPELEPFSSGSDNSSFIVSAESRRRKALYCRALCGIRKGMIQKRRICFLTLTTNHANALGLSSAEKMEIVARDWNVLQTYLKQEFGSFETLYVVTNESNGVVHVLCVGLPFIYFVRIARWWNQIHGMGFIWITKFNGSAKKMADYMMSQYISGQKCLFRFKMSRDFICEKFAYYWRVIKSCSRDYSAKPRRFYDFLVYPVNFALLKRNFVRWLLYYVARGVTLEYIPNPEHDGLDTFGLAVSWR